MNMQTRASFVERRAKMRREYIRLIAETIGTEQWGADQDRYLDYMDTELVALFRQSRLIPPADIIAATRRRTVETLARVDTSTDTR